MQRIRVLVADDHRIFAESLAAALAAEQDVEVVAAGSGTAALRCLDRAATEGRGFDVLLVDADLGEPPEDAGRGPGGRQPSVPSPTAPARGGGVHVPAPAPPLNGAPQSAPSPPAGAPTVPAPAAVPVAAAAEPGESGEAVRNGAQGARSGARPGGIALVGRVRADHSGTRAVVLAERDDPRQAAAALQAGAAGWVAKDCSLSRLLQVIRGVLKDETHLSPALLTGVLRELTASRRHRTESERLVEALTPREHEVLRCMVAGLGRKAVAERLYLSPHTVRTHMQNVLGKLEVHSTLAAVALARRAGVGPVEEVPAPPAPG
ncbi:LuxR C-terminal-related transcriptional regulator [Streptomyces sp. NPDC054784]